MDSSSKPFAPHDQADVAGGPSQTAGEQLHALSSLLERLEERSQSHREPGFSLAAAACNELIQVRLGIAASLFLALRAKHAPTAAHSLRVALGCSGWALHLDLEDRQRDEIEVAALLHDIGKIGVPDRVLLKPHELSSEELLAMQQGRQTGADILNGCAASQQVLDIVRYAAAWYDGGKPGFDRRGRQLPLGSRMVSIVDAFDAMTSDQVYRRAMSRERAMAELFECAGTQFDPHLTRNFCELVYGDRVRLDAQGARRWLERLDAATSNAFWKLGEPVATSASSAIDALFHRKLFDNMLDGVVFVDSDMKILLWNRASERLTGVSAASVLHKQWSPRLVNLRDENLNVIPDEACPVAHAVVSGVQTIRRLTVSGRNNENLSVNAHIAPVAGPDGVVHGATVLLHDASSQITLEEQVQALHERATQDPLTRVANRAEFDRIHQLFIETHLGRCLPCSMIMCDIDHFKKVNDTYGHQAGDAALVCFAALLRRSCRPGDLVARYGGEEFAMLCADCDNSTATERAEQIRRELAGTPQEVLGGAPLTASFGVTEIQAGDTPETMLRRADRALLQAKSNGRNRVVQLGWGIRDQEPSDTRRGWFSWLHAGPSDQLVERTLVSAAPLNIVVQKLRGFAADHHAEIAAIEQRSVSLKVDGPKRLLRRTGDRPVPLLVELKFSEVQDDSLGLASRQLARTVINVAIRPQRRRDRRRSNAVEQARQLLLSLRSYLMAHERYEPAGPAYESGADGGGVSADEHAVADRPNQQDQPRGERG